MHPLLLHIKRDICIYYSIILSQRGLGAAVKTDDGKLSGLAYAFFWFGKINPFLDSPMPMIRTRRNGALLKTIIAGILRAMSVELVRPVEGPRENLRTPCGHGQPHRTRRR